MRFKTLDPLEWWQAKELLPTNMSFSEGAALFLASSGNQRYLTELLALSGDLAPGEALPVPQRMRAAFGLRARSLSDDARHALERLSILRGSITRELLVRAGAASHQEELERNGWLRFEGNGWHFSSELARRLLEGQLPEGTKRWLHNEAAEARAEEGSATEAAYHRALSQGEEPRPRTATAQPAASAYPTVGVAVGDERWLDEATVIGRGAKIDGERVIFSQPGFNEPVSEARFELQGEPLLVHVRGRGVVDQSFAINDDAAPAELELIFKSSTAGTMRLQLGAGTDDSATGTAPLPAGESFDIWLLAPPARQLRVVCKCANAVIELEITAYSPGVTEGPAPQAGRIVQAHVLASPAVTTVVPDGAGPRGSRNGAADRGPKPAPSPARP